MGDGSRELSFLLKRPSEEGRFFSDFCYINPPLQQTGNVDGWMMGMQCRVRPLIDPCTACSPRTERSFYPEVFF